MTIDGIRATARKALHDTMARPAMLYLDPDSAPTGQITVRPHSRTAKIGDLAGTNLSYAETQDREQTVVFWRDQLVPYTGASGSPPRGALVVLSTDEGYWVDNTMPPDGPRVTAEVTRASAAELVGKTLPS